MSERAEVAVGRLDELADPGCREFRIGDGDWPLRGFIVRKGKTVYAYENSCAHLGHPMNWVPDGFLGRDRRAIQCASHGAQFEIETGLCFAGPCLGKSLRKIDVEVRGGIVYASRRAVRSRGRQASLSRNSSGS
jgi:nitrite reductase/ring-hydroxylating ferredoxin subunit